MDIFSFIRDLLVPKVLKKAQLFALAVLTGVALGHTPDFLGIVGVALFFTTYLSTYFYNDIVDLDDDKNKPVYPAKLLARGEMSEAEALFLSSNLFALGVLLTMLYDPALGVLTFLAVFLNNVRSHVREVFTRQALLVLVEYTNFAAAYYAFFHVLPNLSASSVALEFASLYALGHNVYKFRDGHLWRVLTHRKSILLTVLAFLCMVPTAVALAHNPVALVFGIISGFIYVVPQYFFVRRGDLTEQAFVDRSFWTDALLMGLIALWYVIGIWLML